MEGLWWGGEGKRTGRDISQVRVSGLQGRQDGGEARGARQGATQAPGLSIRKLEPLLQHLL